MICKERAAFLLNTEEINRENVARKYSSLSREKQRQLSDLTRKTTGGKGEVEMARKQYEIFLNNAINTDSDSDSQQFGLFLTIARLNHSCCPNAGRGNKEILRRK